MAFKLNTKMLSNAAKELNLTTYQLAERSGVPQPTVSTILSGRNSPDATKLKAICEVLDLDINDVFLKDGDAAQVRLAA